MASAPGRAPGAHHGEPRRPRSASRSLPRSPSAVEVRHATPAAASCVRALQHAPAARARPPSSAQGRPGASGRRAVRLPSHPRDAASPARARSAQRGARNPQRRPHGSNSIPGRYGRSRIRTERDQGASPSRERILERDVRNRGDRPDVAASPPGRCRRRFAPSARLRPDPVTGWTSLSRDARRSETAEDRGLAVRLATHSLRRRPCRPRADRAGPPLHRGPWMRERRRGARRGGARRTAEGAPAGELGRRPSSGCRADAARPTCHAVGMRAFGGAYGCSLAALFSKAAGSHRARWTRAATRRQRAGPTPMPTSVSDAMAKSSGYDP